MLRRLAARARATATVTFDPNVRHLLMGSPEQVMDVVEEMLGVADVVKASSDDIAWLAPGRDPAAVAADWVSRGPALVVVTLGGEGAVAVGPLLRHGGAARRPGGGRRHGGRRGLLHVSASSRGCRDVTCWGLRREMRWARWTPTRSAHFSRRRSLCPR